MDWLKRVRSWVFGPILMENALLRTRLRALESSIAEQNTLIDIQIKLFAHVVPKEKLPPWLQHTLKHEEAVKSEEPDDAELLDDEEDDEQGEEDDQEEVEEPTIADFVEIVQEDVEILKDTIETSLKPAMEGAQVLLSDVNPAFGVRAQEWVVRMDVLCARLDELQEAFEQLAEEAAQVQETTTDDEVLGVG
jgi:translation elongation factor EF-1beta